MPRPCKRRRICAMPGCRRFGPGGGCENREQIVTMTLDEYESVRLIDLEDDTGAVCGPDECGTHHRTGNLQQRQREDSGLPGQRKSSGDCGGRLCPL